jgi:hypothetical protein
MIEIASINQLKFCEELLRIFFFWKWLVQIQRGAQFLARKVRISL